MNKKLKRLKRNEDSEPDRYIGIFLERYLPTEIVQIIGTYLSYRDYSSYLRRDLDVTANAILPVYGHLRAHYDNNQSGTEYLPEKFLPYAEGRYHKAMNIITIELINRGTKTSPLNTDTLQDVEHLIFNVSWTCFKFLTDIYSIVGQHETGHCQHQGGEDVSMYLSILNYLDSINLTEFSPGGEYWYPTTLQMYNLEHLDARFQICYQYVSFNRIVQLVRKLGQIEVVIVITTSKECPKIRLLKYTMIENIVREDIEDEIITVFTIQDYIHLYRDTINGILARKQGQL